MRLFMAHGMGGLRIAGLLVAAVVLAGCQSAPIAALRPDTSTAPLSRQLAGPIAPSTPLSLGTDVAAPSGYIAFCRRDPADCADGGSDTLKLDPQTWDLLSEVNQAWNTAVKPMDDAAHYGRADFWTIPKDGYGDCEDYALGKRRSLIENGVSPAALAISLVRLPSGTPHAVLAVKTDHGAYVLDSLVNEVLPWKATPYEWVAVQITGEHWAAVNTTAGARYASAVDGR